jgi:hypothetical protein
MRNKSTKILARWIKKVLKIEEINILDSQRQSKREMNKANPKPRYVPKEKPKAEDQGTNLNKNPVSPNINAQNVVEKSTLLFSLWKSTQEERDKPKNPSTNIPSNANVSLTTEKKISSMTF